MSTVTRRMATILVDYRFFMTGAVDNLFQFVDCHDVNGYNLARDIPAGVVPIKHRQVVIMLGNSSALDQYMNVASVMMAIANAIFER